MITCRRRPAGRDYGPVLALLKEALPSWKEVDDVKTAETAFEKSTFALFAYDNDRLTGIIRAISDDAAWTLLADLAAIPGPEGHSAKTMLVQACLDRFAGHEVFTVSEPGDIAFYEEMGLLRSKNAFTRDGEDHPVSGYPLSDYYLPKGYRYETEFYPFAGNFPAGQKSSRDLSRAQLRYQTDAEGVDFGEVNDVLCRAFLDQRDRDVTEKTFRESTYLIFAYDGDRLAGCARAVSDTVRQALILNVAVAPDYQGLHLGGNLLDRLCAQMKGQNVFLNTHPGGVGFYNRGPYFRNKTALLYPAHPDTPEEIQKGFDLPKGYRFIDEY